MRKSLLAAALGAQVALVGASARDARACGGCFHPPTPPTESGTVVTDHRMIFAVSSSPAQTTLYDEIKYMGSPSSFAWVLPIHGTVTVGLSSDVLFQAIDQNTTTTIVAPNLPACPQCACPNEGFASGGGFAGSASSGGGPSVMVLAQQVVGPYDTVQLSTNDPTGSSLTTWLTANSFDVPTSVAPIIAMYASEGFNFLAMRLAPGQGVEEMRPVSVTTTGAGLSLPLRMVAAGTGATVGITLWVVSSGRYQPMNFPTFTINAATDLTWDWSGQPPESNYTTVQAQKEAALGNAAWQIESSLNVSPFQIENTVLAGQAETDYPVPAIDAGADDAGPSGLSNPTLAPEQVRQQDLSTCFPGGNATEVRITRMRADLSHAALANDLVLEAATDQSVMSNLYLVTKSVNAPQCPAVDPTTCGCGPSSGSGAGGPTGTTTPAGPGKQSFGCAAAPSDSNGGGIELGLAGLVGFAFIRSRARRKRR
jgi:hypothetical protein